MSNQVAKLVIRKGPDAGSEFALNGPITVLGRQTECAVYLPSKDVSRQHAQVIQTPEGYKLEDLGSTNGTFFKGVRLEPHTRILLSEHDTFVVGPYALSVSWSGSRTPVTTPQRIAYRTADGLLGWLILDPQRPGRRNPGRRSPGRRALLQPGPVPAAWADRPDCWRDFALAMLEREAGDALSWTEESLRALAERRDPVLAVEDGTIPLPLGLPLAWDPSTKEDVDLAEYDGEGLGRNVGRVHKVEVHALDGGYDVLQGTIALNGEKLILDPENSSVLLRLAAERRARQGGEEFLAWLCFDYHRGSYFWVTPAKEVAGE
jgi:hypothetical protein